MKYQEKQKRKRTAAAVIALLIVLAMVAGLVTPFIAYAAPVSTQTVTMTNGGTTGTAQATPSTWQEKEFGQEQFTLDVVVGFDGEYIVGKTASLKGIITNNGAPFRGELQAKAYTYENTGRNGVESASAEYAVYYQELELLQGASQKIDMELNIGTIQRFLQITLVDESGRTVFLQNVDLKPKQPETLAFGILSERPQDMQILAGMMPQGTNQVEASAFYGTYFFDGEGFPSSEALMENFRVIVADGIDFAALTQAQRDALNGWVTGGGMLVIGTGEAGARTLGGLELTADVQITGTAAGSLQGTPVTLAVLEGDGVEPLWQENGAVLAYQKKEGEGRIILPAFSIATTPVAAMAETPAVLWQICSMADSSYLVLDNMEDDRYYHYSSMSNFPPLGMGTVKLLLGLLAVYIFIVGPVLYLVLKKLDKREKGWIAIPALAAVFVAAVFAVSRTSLYGKGMLRMTSVVELSAGADTAAAETDIYLKSADAGSLTYSNEDNLNIFPQKEDYYYYNLSAGDVSCGYKMLSGDRTEITFYGNQSWQTNHLSAKTTVQTGGALESTLRLENGRLKGTVTNGTNTGFVDTILNANGTWLRIGQMQAGETLEIDQPVDPDSAGLGSYSMFERLFYDDYSSNTPPLRERVRRGEISREEAFRIRSEQSLLDNQTNISGKEGLSRDGKLQMDIYAFSEVPIWDSAGTINGREPFVSALTLYHQTFTTELAKLESFDTSFAILPEAVETAEQYDWITRYGVEFFYLYDEGEAELIYHIADGIELELFQFEEIERHSIEEKAQIYNVSTGEWDILRTREYSAPGEYDPAQYISADGKVRLKLFMLEGTEVEVPRMRMKGSGLLAGN